MLGSCEPVWQSNKVWGTKCGYFKSKLFRVRKPGVETSVHWPLEYKEYEHILWLIKQKETKKQKRLKIKECISKHQLCWLCNGTWSVGLMACAIYSALTFLTTLIFLSLSDFNSGGPKYHWRASMHTSGSSWSHGSAIMCSSESWSIHWSWEPWPLSWRRWWVFIWNIGWTNCSNVPRRNYCWPCFQGFHQGHLGDTLFQKGFGNLC